jgi:hypothetical protein
MKHTGKNVFEPKKEKEENENEKVDKQKSGRLCRTFTVTLV